MDLDKDAVIHIVPHETFAASFTTNILNTHTIPRQGSSPAPPRRHYRYVVNGSSSMGRHFSMLECR